MAFTRFKDDPARVNKYLEETTSIGKYHLNTPGNGLANPYIDDCHIILQKWGANLQSNSLLVENELRNLNRPLTRDINTYKKVDSQMYQYPSKHFNIDESRASLPAWLFRDNDNNDKRMDVPLKKENVNTGIGVMPFQNNLQTRILEKDFYTSKYY
jgi:hypothetical protein